MAKNSALNQKSVTIYDLIAVEFSQIGCLLTVCIACVHKYHTLYRKISIIEYQ